MTAAAVVAVVLVVLGTAGGSPSHKPASHASSATTPTVSAVPTPNQNTPTPANPGAGGAGQITPPTAVTGPTINWMGMQISTVQGTGVVVQTVQLGTPADAAGLDPGDVIQTINGHAIVTAGQISAAVRGLQQNDAVQISVERGSTFFSTVVPFDGRPTTGP